MPEHNKRIIVEGVNFSELFHFPKILRACTAAMQPARLVIGLLMVTALITFGRVWDSATTPNVAPAGLTHGLWHLDVGGPVNQAPSLGVFQATANHVSSSFEHIVQGVLSFNVVIVIDGLHHLLIETPAALWQYHRVFAVAFGAFALIVFSIGGGAIARMTACQIANHQRLSVRQAMDFSLQQWIRLLTAQVLPLAILLLLCAVVVAMGVLLAVPGLNVIGGVIYGVALLLGLLIALMLLGYLVGFPMLIPAVACENCDGPDAMQRAYAYAVTRPLHLIGYWTVALIGLAIGFLFVSIVAVATLNATAMLYSTLAANSIMTAAGGYELFNLAREGAVVSDQPWHSQWAAGAVAFWETVVICLVAAYVLAYHFSASTFLYLLMRRSCDGQDIQEIWQPEFVAGTLAAMPGAQPVSTAVTVEPVVAQTE